MTETEPRERSVGQPLSVGLMLPVIANTDSGRAEPRRLLQAARQAEQAGFDGVYVGDHLLHPKPLLESLVALSAVSAVTERVTLGTCVLLIALRDPIWLAKQLGTLSCFAPGRLRVGIGVGGEYPEEFFAVGVTLADRGRQAELRLRELRRLLNGERPHVAAGGPTPVVIAPLPSDPIPYFFGGWKRAALMRAATMADGWIGYLLSPEGFARRRAYLLETRAALESAPFVTGMLLPVRLDWQVEGAQSRAAAAWAQITQNDASFPEHAFVAGPPETVVEQIRRYWEAGCTEIVLSLVDQGESYMTQLSLLAETVLPNLHAFAPGVISTR